MHHKLLAVDEASVKFSGVSGEFSGYASVFGGLDAYGDTIAPGAYKKTIKTRDRPIRMRWNHFGPVIGKWLSMEEDETGLLVRGQLTPGHSVASDVAASLKHGSVDGLSIGYIARKESTGPNGSRLLKEIELIEISIVEEPADGNALIADVKSALEDAGSLKEIEDLLRDVGGFSKLNAKTLVARVKSLLRRDDVNDSETTKTIAQLIANRSIHK